MNFRYRQSAQYLLLFDPAGVVTDSGPPPRSAGDLYLAVDQRGRLHHFEAVPTEADYSSQSDRVIDWDVLFTAAGVDRSRFTSSEPTWIPPVTFDARAAWSGTLAHAPSGIMRIEAASWKRRPTYFRVGIDARPLAGRSFLAGPGSIIFTRAFAVGLWVYYVATWLIAGWAAFIAWRNHKIGRSDVRGASRLAVGVFACSVVGWILTAHHVPIYEYLPAVFRAIGAALTAGVGVPSLDFVSNVMSWSRNCPKNVRPAVWLSLFRLFALSVGSTISATGPAVRSSRASIAPPRWPSASSAAVISGLGAANGGR